MPAVSQAFVEGFEKPAFQFSSLDYQYSLAIKENAEYLQWLI